ncbi:hypothetical protein BTVI_62379 [Pitangus sulphuratus]|nr:hypothetical protein BTVI_62379 [Pitangus sulphuratus]
MAGQGLLRGTSSCRRRAKILNFPVSKPANDTKPRGVVDMLEGKDERHESETPPGVLHPILGSPTQEGHGSVEPSPKKGQKDDHSSGELLWDERAGVVQVGEEKTLGRP